MATNLDNSQRTAAKVAGTSAWCVLCAFIFLIFQNFNKVINDWLFDTPMALFELILSFWLLFKGLSPKMKTGGA